VSNTVGRSELTRAARRLGLAALLLLLAVPLAAQREPVLKQIRVPHPYYFREMYLPQVTSGPSAAAWSPDGRELIYAMQGTLWQQRLGSTEARQLTDGPGYDAQPDWSPDGRWVVYAAYENDAVDLRLLDLSSGQSTPLVANGAVNVEPRWSPDGRRIAYVSTAHEGRWHVFVASVDGGRAAEPVRITDDAQSDLPRYYYSSWDQYLSPTWSPDGTELLLVANRGHVWGSGTIWRMRAEPGAAMREIRDEETTWRARPDWSRDGKRVVYASYLGRQWHQLWLMTSQGENPFQLTYGEFDAVFPRWSPDGQRIAYISNEGGNTSLWTVAVPGGARERVVPARRSYLRPHGQLRIDLLDRATGRPVAARVSVTGPDGRGWAPDDAWRHADDAYDRGERRFEYTYFHANGHATLSLPEGRFTVEVTRGPEYAVERHTVEMPPGAARGLRVSLRRLDDLAARGWWSGDLHVHLNYGGHYLSTPARLRAMAEAEDLHVVENLIVNKEGRVPEALRAVGPDPVSTPSTLIVNDQEYHTSFWGHTGLLGPVADEFGCLRARACAGRRHRVRAPVRRVPRSGESQDAAHERTARGCRARPRGLPRDRRVQRPSHHRSRLVSPAEHRVPHPGRRRHRRDDQLCVSPGAGGAQSRIRAHRGAALVSRVPGRSQGGTDDGDQRSAGRLHARRARHR
jgi:hypothetical protein